MTNVTQAQIEGKNMHLNIKTQKCSYLRSEIKISDICSSMIYLYLLGNNLSRLHMAV